MKLRTQMFIISIIFPAYLTAQDQPVKPGSKGSENNVIRSEDITRDLRIDPENIIDTAFFSDPSLKDKSGRSYNDFIKRFHGKKPYPDFRIAEEAEIYPGAPKFYSRRRIIPSPYEKSFIIKQKPNPFTKYYLIIKDPITHRLIN